ncbi:MAG TPA: hypothetical protein VGJ29_12190 [Vicinamibacterales bacterium]|jgi:hypothetical protein
MDLRRRFVFRGNAAAIGGRIVRPNDLIIDSGIASSLTAVGGRSLSKGGPKAFGDFISYGAVETLAEGLFDRLDQHIELTHKWTGEDQLTTTTRVHAEVNDLNVGRKPKLTVKRLHAALLSKSPGGSGEPAIAAGPGTIIEGAAIDGHGIVVDLATEVFQKYDTRSKLLTAIDDPTFVKESGACFFMKPPATGGAAVALGRLLHACGTIHATIVRSIRWAGDPFPGATIDHNSITVPDFGKIFFGELIITDLSRRLTLMRLELGSPDGGTVAATDVESTGIWS